MLLEAVSPPVAMPDVLPLSELWPIDELADLLGAKLPGEAPGAAGAALGAPVGAGALEAVLLLPVCVVAEEDIAPPAGAIVLWPAADLAGAILPGEPLGAPTEEFGAPVGAGAELAVCAMAKLVDIIRAAEAIKSDRMCVSCETGLFLSRHVARPDPPHKKVCLNSLLNPRH